jgi:hypothetical protein
MIARHAPNPQGEALVWVVRVSRKRVEGLLMGGIDASPGILRRLGASKIGSKL